MDLLYVIQAIFIASSLIAVFIWDSDGGFDSMRWFGFIAFFGLWFGQNFILFLITPLVDKLI